MKSQLSAFVGKVIEMRKAQNSYFKQGKTTGALIAAKQLEIEVDREAARLSQILTRPAEPLPLSEFALVIGLLTDLKPRLHTTDQMFVDYVIRILEAPRKEGAA